MYRESNKTIYETTDYDMFKPLLGNRDAKCEKKIEESINKVGYIFDPVIVNENFEVIDGHNRIGALKRLGLPVYFSIEAGLDIEACRCMNIGRTNWTPIDYITSYSATGNMNYQRLMSLISEFKKHMGYEAILMMAFPKNGLSDGRGFTARCDLREGKLIFSNDDFQLAKTRLGSSVVLGYADYAKEHKMKQRSYWGAVSYIYQHQDVSAKEMIDKIRLSSAEIPSCLTVSDQLKYFEQAYNKGKKKNKVFLSADFQRKLYIEKER